MKENEYLRHFEPDIVDAALGQAKSHSKLQTPYNSFWNQPAHTRCLFSSTSCFFSCIAFS